MENSNYIILAVLAIYFIYDFYINKDLLKSDKMKMLGVYNMLFLIGIISVSILKPVIIIQYCWFIILLALPSFIFSDTRIQNIGGG